MLHGTVGNTILLGADQDIIYSTVILANHNLMQADDCQF